MLNKHFPKEGVKMTKRHRNRFSTSPIISKMQIKPHEKVTTFLVTIDERWGERKLEECGQNIQILSYKVNNRDGMYNMMFVVTAIVQHTGK